MATLIFVHGTGVREEAYEQSLQQVGQKLLARRADLTIMPCFWGAEHGAKLNQDGASIPEYDTARVVGAIGSDDYEIALWSLLYDDPLFELRVLGTSGGKAGGFMPGRATPYQQLDEAAAQLSPAGALAPQLREYRLLDEWNKAVPQVRASAEYKQALQSAPAASAEYRLAIARALVAQALRLSPQAHTIWLDGAAREHLVEDVLEALGGRDRGPAGWVRKQLSGLALRFVTSRAQRKRGAISDAAYPAAGDILLYQARGGGIRGFIRETILQAPPPVVVLAHSLGGIACVDLLIMEQLPVELLITVGSQSPFFYEIDALASLRFGDPLPEHFPQHWLNIYDLRDFLSYIAAGVFAGQVSITDVKVDNHQPFPQSHSAYWSNNVVWEAIAKKLP